MIIFLKSIFLLLRNYGMDFRFSAYFSSINSFMHAQPSSGASCLIFGRNLRLLPYFMCANSKGSGETGWMRRLACAFAGHLCDKYHNLMSWLKLFLKLFYGSLCFAPDNATGS